MNVSKWWGTNITFCSLKILLNRNRKRDHLQKIASSLVWADACRSLGLLPCHDARQPLGYTPDPSSPLLTSSTSHLSTLPGNLEPPHLTYDRSRSPPGPTYLIADNGHSGLGSSGKLFMIPVIQSGRAIIKTPNSLLSSQWEDDRRYWLLLQCNCYDHKISIHYL